MGAKGISVLYLSGYSTDFVFVTINDLEESLEALRESGFEIKDGDDLHSALGNEFQLEAKKENQEENMALETKDLGENFFVMSFGSQHVKQCLWGMMKVLFPKNVQEGRFIFMLVTKQEITMMINSSELELFKNEGCVEVLPTKWSLMNVSHGGFSEAGIVATLAKPLAARKISLFYISTFSSDFLLVPSNVSQEAKSCLENQNQ